MFVTVWAKDGQKHRRTGLVTLPKKIGVDLLNQLLHTLTAYRQLIASEKHQKHSRATVMGMIGLVEFISFSKIGIILVDGQKAKTLITGMKDIRVGDVTAGMKDIRVGDVLYFDNQRVGDVLYFDNQNELAVEQNILSRYSQNQVTLLLSLSRDLNWSPMEWEMKSKLMSNVNIRNSVEFLILTYSNAPFIKWSRSEIEPFDSQSQIPLIKATPSLDDLDDFNCKIKSITIGENLTFSRLLPASETKIKESGLVFPCPLHSIDIVLPLGTFLFVLEESTLRVPITVDATRWLQDQVYCVCEGPSPIAYYQHLYSLPLDASINYTPSSYSLLADLVNSLLGIDSSTTFKYHSYQCSLAKNSKVTKAEFEIISMKHLFN